ncbi:energy-coupling factor transporter transmembrane protein EcfT [Budviciaceae bacterium BWR-B9]|uniref:Energy-coupling factor transporter transmembrane protein EcfT n=1 Tax=Limnobaculum allomyrinae TaxID=2791986 RepID=A0ABS1IVD9_9GAMM|nr:MULTISPECIES: energy-coupling factor transporter transmembrane component T [Limnobaculum]MBK5145717.1 energy-coupling factor transporter transmembrane protein EcfT [Limnobaculum allomyrinae]MBV7693749.1 energy-coupling factor transporter transmembrane protein EcfT [Limnobaculum sp. M2-1]
MHPFTSLMLWGWLALTTLLLPLGYTLLICSASLFALLLILPDTRHRWRYVVWFMVPMGLGLWLVHSGWLAHWLNGTPLNQQRMPMATALWLKLLAIISSAQIWLEKVPTRQFVRALFSSRLPISFAYVLAGPLLIVEQLRQQLHTIRDAQLARGIPLDGNWHQRLKAIPALLLPLTSNAINELAIRGAALDMKAFRTNAHRTTLWAPPDSRLQQIIRYALLLLCFIQIGGYFWWLP